MRQSAGIVQWTREVLQRKNLYGLLIIKFYNFTCFLIFTRYTGLQ